MKDPLEFENPKDERAFYIHNAKVMLNEAERRRGSRGGFHATLLKWAANSRRRAAAAMGRKPLQGELF